MAYDSPVVMDQVSVAEVQHEVIVNGDLVALSNAALFGAQQSQTQGLSFTLYGGMFPSSGSFVVIPTTTIKLTPSATNYIYVTVGGTITKTTSSPAGWPGPLANAARALYQLTVGADAVTGGTCYVQGVLSPGPDGVAGAVGPAGAEIYLRRARWISDDNNVADVFGFDVTTSAGANNGVLTLGSTYWSEGIVRRQLTTTSVANTSTQVRSTTNKWFIGNAAGRGGFTLFQRWSFANSSNANQRCFIGLYDAAGGAFTNADPDTFVNLVGVGAKSGDTNLSSLCNDGSGTATMSALGSNFPMKSTDNTYELTLTCAANGSSIAYTLVQTESGNQATGVFSSNIPANTQFLGFIYWVNSGSSSTSVPIDNMQTYGFSRY